LNSSKWMTLEVMNSRAILFVAIVVTVLIVVAAFVPVLNKRTTPSTSQSLTSTEEILTPVGYHGNFSLWLTYHRDNSRTGFDPSMGVLQSVRPGWSSTVDGVVYAEPLVYGGRLFVATESNSIIALNESNGRILWMRNLGEPVPRSDLPCGDIDPTGITGTPVIDPASNLIFAVVFLRASHQHWLYALDLRNGVARFSRPIDPPGANPLIEQQRAALSLSNGMVYVPFGGLFGDCGSYHGWVVGVRADNSGSLLSYQVPTGRAGGIWATSGAVIDSAGNILVATGNSFSVTSFDFGDSVIKLSPSLQPIDWFAPQNWLQLNEFDTDLGSAGPTLLAPNTVFQIGKEGVGYLIDENRLGNVGGELFSSKVCSGAFGGASYAASYLYVPCRDGLVALHVSNDRTFTVAWRGTAFNAGPPIVVAGAVWTIDINKGDLYAFNATNGQVIFKNHIGPVAHFTTPSAGDGQIFVAAQEKIVSFVLE
jgi:outer membrane protein assembly factor BamB